ncbi:MAG: DNA repair protein RecO [Anaerolineaceae bacterium]|nr:DNA repair protein RecO [Anaerolineaceae bacterium]
MRKQERTLKTEVLVLRHFDFGEADRILVVYSRERGKIKMIAKGVRKIRSRKAGHIQPFSRAILMLAKGHDFWILTQADLQEAYQPIRESLEKTGLAAYVMELVDKFTTEEDEQPAVYRLLQATLKRISDEVDTFIAVRYFEIRFLDYMGYRPELFNCVRCSENIQAEDQYFSAREGGVICPRCNFDDTGRRISMLALKYFRHLQRSAYKDAKKAQIEIVVQQEMETFIQYYLTYILERGLKTPGFIRAVGKDID